MSPLFQLLLLASLGSFVGLLGGIVMLSSKKWSNVLEHHAISFAAGVMITVALVGILPESVEFIDHEAYVAVLITFLATFLFERLFLGIHHHDEHEGCASHTSSIPSVLLGDTIHNFIDGIAIGVSFLVSPGLGLVTAISTFLHEVPHEIADFGIFLKAGWKKSRIILVNIISAAVTLVGALTIYFFPVSDYLIGILLAVAAGIFLYLGASDFLPQTRDHDHEGSKIKGILPLILGALIMLAVMEIVPHGH
ncbi:MAG: hypothetical protein COU65_04520 [Candidatus Pacebacteria bacterium CG10_big_fil_rev_8_21_14_0_10_42_12]|nr:ZIP family metal transporter [Candidatus Paceibacterota bacterium]PIR62229.1 MAG: hypothetical protein COU65_04520 [Candidatus Pacebacteria bacterium CG10_big_fil_rev_8_21_14_0_10_42_12]